MPASSRRGGKSKHPASPPNSRNFLKSPPKKKFHSVLSNNGVNATNSRASTMDGGTRRKAGNSVRATYNTGRVSNTVQMTNMFNVRNKILEDITTQDDEAMSDNSDDDNVNHNGDKASHTNTRTKRRLHRSLCSVVSSTQCNKCY